MSSFHARKAALDMALRHLGPEADFDKIFNTADRFAAYLDLGRTKQQPRSSPAHRWSEAMIAELMACKDDPLAFLERIKILHPLRGAIPFEPYAFQKEFVEFIKEERFSHTTHARQMGISTCLAAFILWSALFEGTGCVSLIVSRSLTGSIDIMDRIRSMYETLPDHLKIPVTTYNKTRIVFENGNEINAVAASNSVGRGRAIKNLYIDQMAWISHSIGREFWTAIQPIITTGGARCVLTSTGGDTDGIFFDIKRTIPRNGFAGMDIPWHRHPERDEEWARSLRRLLGEAAFSREFLCEFVSQPKILRSDKPAP
jgi:hypothetical protein